MRNKFHSPPPTEVEIDTSTENISGAGDSTHCSVPSRSDSTLLIKPGTTSRMATAGSVCVDYFDAGFFVRWSNWEATRQKLMVARVSARIDGRENFLAGTYFSVDLYGRRVGKSEPFFEFVLTGKDCHLDLLIQDVRAAGPTVANFRATFPGKYFLYTGSARHGYEMLRNVVHELGGQIERSELSRIDICLDLPNICVQDFIDAYHAGQYISRSKTRITYASECDTLYFGKNGSQIRCCIYDKLCESRKKQGMLEVMRRRWDGEIPECATRVEFRVRRQALKRRGIDQIEDLFRLEGNLLDYLTTKWLRFTDMPVDRGNNNQRRVGILPLWSQVHDKFLAGVGGLSGEPWAPIPPSPANVSNLGKQAVGVVLAAAKAEGRPLRQLAEFNAYSQEIMQPYAEKRLPLVICGGGFAGKTYPG